MVIEFRYVVERSILKIYFRSQAGRFEISICNIDKMESKLRPSAVEAEGLHMNFWHEVRLQDNRPERRSYHSAITYNGDVYVYGGKDLREGVFTGLWILHIDPYDDANDYWEKVETAGVPNAPHELSRHTAVVHADQMHIFGGTDNSAECNTLYSLDFGSKTWT
jgi:hypothetical protein